MVAPVMKRPASETSSSSTPSRSRSSPKRPIGNIALDRQASLAREEFAIEVGHDPARRDGVDADALEREFERQRLGDLDHAGLGGGVGNDALVDAKAEHRGDVDDGAGFFRRQHAARGFLRPEEHGVEIGRQHAAPFLFGKVDRAARMRDARIVDEDGDRAESFFGGVERSHHRGAVKHIGLDRDGAAAGLFDARLDRRETIGAPRDQNHRCAVLGQTLGETHAKAARRAGHQRHLPGEIEDLCGCHGSSPHRA